MFSRFCHLMCDISSICLNRLLQSIKEYNRVLEGVTECYRVLQRIAENCRVLQSIVEYKGCITEYYRVLQSVTECYKVLQMLQSVTQCYRVLQKVTEFFRVLQSISEYNKVLQYCRVLQSIFVSDFITDLQSTMLSLSTRMLRQSKFSMQFRQLVLEHIIQNQSLKITKTNISLMVAQIRTD